ncbi:Hpt domain-containing protein [Spongiimicrobium sp. 3-5]|uniref:Hpt domain-containing protein n=1 Tax=Spongiimicrobium sp. 3-5 TaxID=3332596 RepID=UPI00397EF8CD
MRQERPNIDYIKELAGDDEAFEKKFITILQEEFPLEKEEYLDNVKHKRPRAAALNVHKLKHKFNVLGLAKGYGLAVAYEEDLRNGDMALHAHFLKVLETIEAYIKTI